MSLDAKEDDTETPSRTRHSLKRETGLLSGHTTPGHHHRSKTDEGKHIRINKNTLLFSKKNKKTKDLETMTLTKHCYFPKKQKKTKISRL